MKEKQNINRRNFLKTIGAAGLGSVIASSQLTADEDKSTKSESAQEAQQPMMPQVPRRKLGKTGLDVPVLSLGAMYNVIDKQIVLRKTLEWGVNLWDTAYEYAGGNSERGIGKFLVKNPDIRKDVFIVSKASEAETPDEIESRLQSSLKRMNTDYIDLYYGVHDMAGPSQLTNELRQWAENAKKRKLIRYFGFSTHKDMAKCLDAAAKLDWIDAILFTYNFRVMQEPELQDAVEACYQADIGLIAMKVTGLQSWYRQKIESEEDKKMIKHFTQKGFTEGQATIKTVLEDKRISSACIGMQNIALLTQNVAAVLDKTELTRADRDTLVEYARSTCSGYCAGCGHICCSAVGEVPYINDIMRYLMYYNSYGDENRARELFAKIPAKVRNKLLSIDYSLAEAQCPQQMPIGKLIAEAVRKLA